MHREIQVTKKGYEVNTPNGASLHMLVVTPQVVSRVSMLKSCCHREVARFGLLCLCINKPCAPLLYQNIQ